MAEINTPVAKVLDGERAATFDEQLIPRVTKECLRRAPIVKQDGPAETFVQLKLKKIL